MHDARRLTKIRGRRMLASAILAVMLAATGAAVTHQAWSPICLMFEEGSIEWYLFFCYIDPPPKNPGT